MTTSIVVAVHDLLPMLQRNNCYYSKINSACQDFCCVAQKSLHKRNFLFINQLELQKLHIENQLDINETLLNKIEDIEKLNATQIEIIEKKLIKKKLKRASQAMEIPSLLALPFVRNKYFFYFTIGLFVNNHFNFLHHIFRRKTKHYTTIDLSALRNGQDALNNALNLTAENIMYLEYLEQETLQKYPDLALDDEYLNMVWWRA